MYKAFRSRNYTLFFSGQICSNVGYLIQYLALSWLVLKLTNSALYVGILYFIIQGANFLISPIAGVISDRYNRFTILLITNISSVLTDGLLAVLTLTGVVTISHIFILMFISGTIKGLDLIVRSAFINDIVDTNEQLINAISLNSSMFNIAKIVGSGIAGFIIIKYGEGFCFLINSFTYLLLVIAIMFMKKKPHTRSKMKVNIPLEISEGFQYVFKSAPMRVIVFYIACIGLFGFPYTSILPVYAKNVLHGDADMLGLLTIFSGIGALLSALFMANKKNSFGFEIYILIAGLLFSSGVFALSFSSNLSLTFLLLIITGFGQVMAFASANSTLQTISKNNKIGRVLSIYIMLFMGTTMLGSLAGGKLTDLLGVVTTFRILGIGLAVCTFVYALQIKKIRRKTFSRYVRLGILSINFLKQKSI